jgi:hypothetical protein
LAFKEVIKKENCLMVEADGKKKKKIVKGELIIKADLW